MTRVARNASRRPLIAHVVHRFDVGGTENGVVNLINGLVETFADHCVVAMTESNPLFAARLSRPDVRVIAFHKPPGQTLWHLPSLTRLFRSLRPAVVHTRNVATLETQIAAWAAGVPIRVHGEHGWDVGDLTGENRRMQWLRQALRRLVHRQIALSEPTYRYLVEQVGVPETGVTNICNGVDTARFTPATDRGAGRARLIADDPLASAVLEPGTFVIGAIGRLAPVKNPQLLVDAFAAVRERNAGFALRARLILIGDGPLEGPIRAQLDTLGLKSVTWMPGRRDDVPECLQALDLLCLPSLAEGISNAILEAMACGLPVVATNVGGNRELLADGVTGMLVSSGNTLALAAAMEAYFEDPARAQRAGIAGRARAVTEFSLDSMIDKYHKVYASEFERAGFPASAPNGALRSPSNA